MLLIHDTQKRSKGIKKIGAFGRDPEWKRVGKEGGVTSLGPRWRERGGQSGVETRPHAQQLESLKHIQQDWSGILASTHIFWINKHYLWGRKEGSSQIPKPRVSSSLYRAVRTHKVSIVMNAPCAIQSQTPSQPNDRCTSVWEEEERKKQNSSRLNEYSESDTMIVQHFRYPEFGFGPQRVLLTNRPETARDPLSYRQGC